MKVAQFDSFICSCSDFPAPLFEKAVLSPLYILAYFFIG